MMKRRMNLSGRKRETAAPNTTSSSVSNEGNVLWEMRPGGMLVQKRSDNKEAPAMPNWRIRVAYGAVRYEISANSQATFGELKKLITAKTGLEPGEQRLIFRGKERENCDYLDMCGVKDRSKVILIDDPESKERKLIEMRRNAKIQTAHRLIDDVSVEVDTLAQQVSVIEKSIVNGTKVAELQITTLIEMLMGKAVKLDSICVEGDACAKKDFQANRVKQCVEALDVLKVANANVKPIVVTTKWEIFDPSPATTQWEIFD